MCFGWGVSVEEKVVLREGEGVQSLRSRLPNRKWRSLGALAVDLVT